MLYKGCISALRALTLLQPSSGSAGVLAPWRSWWLREVWWCVKWQRLVPLIVCDNVKHCLYGHFAGRRRLVSSGSLFNFYCLRPNVMNVSSRPLATEVVSHDWLSVMLVKWNVIQQVLINCEWQRNTVCLYQELLSVTLTSRVYSLKKLDTADINCYH